jgi:hypothetical protein
MQFPRFSEQCRPRDPLLNISSIACIGFFFTQSLFSIIHASLIILFTLISQVLTIYFLYEQLRTMLILINLLKALKQGLIS